MDNETFLVVFFLCFLCFRIADSSAQSVPAHFVFGDSLVDVGNNNYLPLSLVKANFPHNGVDFPTKQPTGRFCNGKNIADFIAEKLRLPSAPPYLSLKLKNNRSAVVAGVSFASGGAGIFNGSDQALQQSRTFSQQVNDFLSLQEDLMNELLSDAQNHISKSLFSIVIGSNDLIDYFGSLDLRRKNDLPRFVELMSVKLKEQLKRLYVKGARKFLVIGVGKIGCIPHQRMKHPAQKCNQKINFWCAKYNEALKTMLRHMKLELRYFSYSFFDAYKVMEDIAANPSAFGFTDVKSACCGLGKLNAEIPCVPISVYCWNRTIHLFWDRYGHPTEAASRVYVNLMFGGSSRYAFPLSAPQLIAA